MLKSLFIKNVALISRLSVDFDEKINVFSGETGAGKSIIIDALEFLLGAKADKSLIRHGEDTSVVEGVFDVTNCLAVKSLLSELNFDEDDEILISRSMALSGRNEIKINGRSVTLSVLRDVTSKLVDVHGQSEHFALSKVSTHLELLDKFGKAELSDKKAAYTKEYEKYVALKKELAAFGGDEGERARLIDLYSFQIEEIEEANLFEGEEEELSARFALVTNAEKIATALSGAHEAMSGEMGAMSSLSAARDFLSSIDNLSDKIPELKERLSSCLIELDDVSETISDMVEELDFDDREADKIAERLERIKALKRKYGKNYAEIAAFLERTKKECEKLVNASEEIERLNAEIEKQRQTLKIVGNALTKERKTVAKRFSDKIVSELKELGMENASFDVEFKDGDFDELLSKDGLDSVEFMFSANLGEPLMPLIKVISGGEMSRFMLGLKTITAGLDNIGTLVFDEIDTGISGKIAHVVAEKFVRLSKSCQLLVITHLPQIAATADKSLFIAKGVVGDHTETSVKVLSEDEKLSELVRLSGAKAESSAAKENAKELEEYYKTLKNQKE